jgi:hypothetical protein
MLILGEQLSLQILSVCAVDRDSENGFSGEEEMAGRTLALLLARELFYSAWESSSNYRSWPCDILSCAFDTYVLNPNVAGDGIGSPESYLVGVERESNGATISPSFGL